MLKKYRVGFDIFGLLLFLLVMIPNFIWFEVPATNDILRAESITPLIDGIGSVSQVIFIAAICILKRKGVDRIRLSKLIILSLAMVITYFIGWILYYNGIVNLIAIILLTIHSAKPLVTRLKELVKSLTIKCVNLMEQVKRLKEKVTQQTSDIEWYKGKLKEQACLVEKLQEKVADLERVKRYAGAEKVQSMVDSVKEIERLENEQKWLQRSYNRGMSR